MTCYHPMKGFIIGKTDNGKKDLKIAPYDTECVFLPKGSDIWEKHGHVLDRLVVQGKVVTEFVPIPCGQCIGCRIDYSKQWATRCMLESEYHDSNYFLTLTYDEEHVPRSEYVDVETGEIKESLTLVKKDLQDFNKRLRIELVRKKKKQEKQGVFLDWTPEIRFYACGEYGSTSARPHYHMIVFGLHLDDLELYKRSPTGNLYNSPFLDKIWKQGHVVIGEVTYESCAYVSRYIMKKQKGQNYGCYQYYNILPEFTVMSRNPGIGKSYFEDNFEHIYSSDSIVLAGGKCVSPPKYFDVLMNELDEELMENVKLKRKDIAEAIQEYKLALSTADYQMQLRHAENNKSAQIKKLVRPLD